MEKLWQWLQEAVLCHPCHLRQVRGVRALRPRCDESSTRLKRRTWANTLLFTDMSFDLSHPLTGRPSCAMLCRATQDGWIILESSYKTWSTEEGNGKPLQYSCLENPMSSMKRQEDRTLKDELTRSVGAQYTSGDQWRNNSRKNEETEPKEK